MWYQCRNCKTATNSPKVAINHHTETGHTLTEEKDA